MVNYVCRTCLYVCDNEFTFRKLEKVKPVLELFVPEIKNCIGKYSLICEQCYYFLKNVEKFKVKCMETQNKLYSMNIETIRDNHDAVLKSVANEAPIRLHQRPPPPYSSNLEYIFQQKRAASERQERPKKVVKKTMRNVVVPEPAAKTSNNNITLISLLQSSEKPSEGRLDPFFPYLTTQQTNESTVAHSSVSNDLLQLFDYGKDINDLQSFREFAVKPSHLGANQPSVANKQVIMNYNDDIGVVGAEDDTASNKDEDEYMTRKDLVAAGILPDLSDKETPEAEKVCSAVVESESDEDLEIVEINSSEGEENSLGNNAGRVEIKIASSNKHQDKIVTKANHTSSSPDNTIVTVKTEKADDENPGFFNKQSADGYYNCRLCEKQYKTSKGLYNHTKEKHGDHVRFHHCDYCSFFTLWKSALMRHYSVFHGDKFSGNNTSTFKCFHCSFKSEFKEQLSQHILDNHSYTKFMRCSLCRARFTDNSLFAKHVEKEHLTLDMPTSSNFCSECTILFLTDEDYRNHVKEKHENLSCVRCNMMFCSKAELCEHNRNLHTTSFGASVLP